MARGWESKAVESQIEAASDRAIAHEKERCTAEGLVLERERDILNLSRTRVLQDMENALNPRYKEQLQRSLGFLDEKIAELEARRNGA